MCVCVCVCVYESVCVCVCVRACVETPAGCHLQEYHHILCYLELLL